MQDQIVHALCAQRAQIHAHWETLLRTERVTSPMANPDTLVFLIDSTLTEIFAALHGDGARHRNQRSAFECPCGRNPLLAYFVAGEQVMLEALILIQASTPGLQPAERDAAMGELLTLVRSIARREIKAFCAVCQHRHEETHTTIPFPINQAQAFSGPCNFSR